MYCFLTIWNLYAEKRVDEEFIGMSSKNVQDSFDADQKSAGERRSLQPPENPAAERLANSRLRRRISGLTSKLFDVVIGNLVDLVNISVDDLDVDQWDWNNSEQKTKPQRPGLSHDLFCYFVFKFYLIVCECARHKSLSKSGAKFARGWTHATFLV